VVVKKGKSDESKKEKGAGMVLRKAKIAGR